MNKLETENESALQLDSNEGCRQVVVNPKSQDKFVTTVSEAAEFCELGTNFNEDFRIVGADLNKLIQHCKNWSDENKSSVSRVFISPHENRITVFVTPKTRHFDIELAGKVAMFSHEIGQTYNSIRLEAIEVMGDTEDQIECFVNIEKALQIYGTTIESQKNVDQKS